MYSQEKTVLAILDFYRQLTRLTYLDESKLYIPPSGGWQDINFDKDSLRDKTPAVKELLRHLPYLRQDRPYHPTQPGRRILLPPLLLTWETQPLCYLDERGWAESTYRLPPHCVYLTEGMDREGTYLILDTERGNIIEFNRWATLQPQPIIFWEEFEAMPEELKWTAFKTMPVVDFFMEWTRMFTRLVWIVVSSEHPDRGAASGHFYSRALRPREHLALAASNDPLEEWHPEVEDEPQHIQERIMHTANIYNTHLRYGWPHNFNREGCKDALLNLEEGHAELERQRMEEASRIDEELYGPRN